MESLDNEIYRLSHRQEEIEQHLDKNMMGLWSNAGSMAWNSFMQSGLIQSVISGNVWTNMASRLFKSKKLQDGVGKLVDNLTDKIGDGIDKVASKLHRDKKQDPTS
jgi:uncharacterized protein YbcC (UPF0753/DUF2309 family)